LLLFFWRAFSTLENLANNVFDVSNENIQMQDFQDAHVAQQQDMMQQEQEHLAYNASDDQPDYCNNADIQDA
jgi:hypothetical protein